MSVSEQMRELGGVATRRALLARLSRAEIDAALRSGEIVADARGRYALPVTDESKRLAHAMSGILSLTSAALYHGWEVKDAPDKPHLLVPRKRKVAPELRQKVHLHRADLTPDDITDGIATGVDLTLLQCFRALDWDAALAIGDSAARHGVPPAAFRRVANLARGPGGPRIRRLTSEVRAEAANPFESVLRAIALDVPGLTVKPQVRLTGGSWTARPDLVDRDLRIVLEADSFEWHGERSALRRDARRYNLLVVDGWIVLRFAYEDVMYDQDYVRVVLEAAVGLVTGRTKGAAKASRAA